MDQADSVHSTPPINTSANNPPDGPDSPQDSLYLPTDVSPEEVFQAIGRLRKEARDEIDRLIRFLDESDNHMAIEDCAVDDDPCDDADEGNAEPSLGWTEQEARWGKHANPADIDAELDTCDDEPALGSVNTYHNHTRWTEGNADDREGDGCADDREGDELVHGGEAVHENDEPSLGWTDEEAAIGRTYAGTMGLSADLEEGDGARPPQNLTEIERPPLTVECSYRRFLHGLPADQKAALQERMRSDSKVSLR
jgi:hypothetical protein